MAVSCFVPPAFIVVVLLSSDTPVTDTVDCVTVTAQEPYLPLPSLAVALMEQVPAPTAVTLPACVTVATDVYWGIPISCVSALPMIGTVTEALSCQHFNFVRPAFFETTMKTKLSGTVDDTNMLDLAASKLSIDFGYAYQSTLSGMGSLDDLVRDGVKHDTVASTFSKTQKSMNKGLEKLLQKYEELP